MEQPEAVVAVVVVAADTHLQREEPLRRMLVAAVRLDRPGHRPYSVEHQVEVLAWVETVDAFDIVAALVVVGIAAIGVALFAVELVAWLEVQRGAGFAVVVVAADVVAAADAVVAAGVAAFELR